MSSSSPIDDRSGDYVTLGALPQNTSAPVSPRSPAVTSIGASWNVQLSPLALVTSTMRQLQQSAPAEYRQAAQQIAANLQTDAQTAQSGGDMITAGRLRQLASAFTTASQSGELPNLEDLVVIAGL